MTAVAWWPMVRQRGSVLAMRGAPGCGPVPTVGVLVVIAASIGLTRLDDALHEFNPSGRARLDAADESVQTALRGQWRDAS